MSTFLQGIAKKAREQPKHRFGNLDELLDEAYLRECWGEIRKDAAYGVDQVSAEAYEQHLEENIHDLVERLKGKRYRAKLVKRQYIPKGEGQRRPLGMPMYPAYCTSCEWLWEWPWSLYSQGAGGCTSSFSIRLVYRFGERRGLRCRLGLRNAAMIAGVRVIHRGLCEVFWTYSKRPVRHQSAIVLTSTFSSWAAAWAA